MSHEEAASKFAQDNPTVLVELVDLARQLKRRGHERYSIKGLFEVLRHRRALETQDRFSEFKLNNNYTAYYARMIMSQYPDLRGFFATRGDGEKPELDLFGQPVRETA